MVIQSTEKFYNFSRINKETLRMRLMGRWTLDGPQPSISQLRHLIESDPGLQEIRLDAQALMSWDSSLLIFLAKVLDLCKKKGIGLRDERLPEGARRLLALAATVPEPKEPPKPHIGGNFLAKVGTGALEFMNSNDRILAFIGEVAGALMNFLRGRARFRRSDLSLFLQESGAGALPLVALISMLVGLIFAFMGAIQLRMFGAQIYVANLVGIAMAREMGAVMTGIIMAGRSGSAFAAQLGTMQVNEEIDALKTLGISPMEFLVLPRMIALTLMMPLLCLYSDLMGVLGGLIVSIAVLDVNMVQYYHQTRAAVTLGMLGVGIFQSLVFGVLVALSGCLRGMQCGRSASAVGDAATSAVVTAIVSIIVATAVITVACSMLGI